MARPEARPPRQFCPFSGGCRTKATGGWKPAHEPSFLACGDRERGVVGELIPAGRLVPGLGWPALRTNGVLQPQLARRPLNPLVFAERSAPLDAHPHAPEFL